MGKFNKGLLVGGLLGAGLMWLNATKAGKEKREELLKHAARVYEEVKAKINDPKFREDLSKNKYVAMVKETVDKYSAQYNLSGGVKKMVEKLVGMQWKNVKKGK